MQDNPDMIKQGLSFVAANPGLVASSSSAGASGMHGSDRPTTGTPPPYSSHDTV